MSKIFVANNTGTLARELAKSGLYGNLFSPDAQRKPAGKDYALDNGRFISWFNNTPWSEESYIKLLEWAKKQPIKPLWALVPDVVANKEATLKEWDKWLPIVKRYGFIPAFAVQDGMDIEDVPSEAKVVFVGGTKEWKWSTLEIWAKNFKRVHVGAVNSDKQLSLCVQLGVESVDGTGWFRGDKRQRDTIVNYCSGKPINLFCYGSNI